MLAYTLREPYGIATLIIALQTISSLSRAKGTSNMGVKYMSRLTSQDTRSVPGSIAFTAALLHAAKCHQKLVGDPMQVPSRDTVAIIMIDISIHSAPLQLQIAPMSLPEPSPPSFSMQSSAL